MAFFRRHRKDPDLEAEIQAHLTIAIEERIERGESRAEATANARREFGNVALVQEVTRSMWRWSRVERIVDGLRHAIRYNVASFLREPVSGIVITLTLGLILAGNVTMFGAANALLRNRPGAGHPERLVDFVHSVPGRTFVSTEFPYRDYLDYRERLATLEGLAAFTTFDRAGMRTPDGTVDAVRLASVSGNYFEVLELTPASGRFFTLDDDRDAAQATAVISHRLWQERFGGASSAVGSSVMLNGGPYVVIGVAPKTFLGTTVFRDDVWVPLAKGPSQWLRNLSFEWLGVVGRLKPGVSVEAAQASVDVVAKRLAQEATKEKAPDRGGDPILGRWHEGTEEAGIVAGLIALALIGLLVGCVNVASIGIARALARTPEITVRLALGAPRRSIVWQLLTETVVFFLPAAALGAILATWFARARIVTYIDLDMSPDWRVLLFTLAVVFVAAIVAGLTPALQAISTKPTGNLKGDSSGSRKGQRLHSLLIPIQVSASVTLLVVGGLYFRTVYNATTTKGFDAANLHVIMLDFAIGGLEQEGGRQLARQLVPLVNTVPGVESAGLALGIPGTGTMYTQTGIWMSGQALDPRNPTAKAALNSIAPGYLKTLGIPVVRGRDVTAADQDGTKQVALVSQELARKLGFGDDATGRTVYRCPEAKCAVEIVGVVANGATSGSPEPVFYRPLDQHYFSSTMLVFKSTRPGTVVSSTRRLLKELNPNVPVLETLSVATLMRDALFYQYLGIWSAGSLGLITLVMAALGIYGVASFAVSSRMREIGIRTTLGARPGRVVGGLLRGSLVMSAIGLAAGCAAGLLIARSIPQEPGFFGVSYFDPMTYACTALAVLAIVFLAGFVPARRAASSDPMLVLRHE